MFSTSILDHFLFQKISFKYSHYVESECDSLNKFFSKLSIALLEDVQESSIHIYPDVTKIDRKCIYEQSPR